MKKIRDQRTKPPPDLSSSSLVHNNQKPASDKSVSAKVKKSTSQQKIIRPKKISRTPKLVGDNNDAAEHQALTTEKREQTADLREHSADARELVADRRELVADRREESIQLKDQLVHRREKVVSSREKTFEEADEMKAALESHMEKLLQANEQLVITTLKSQSLADEVMLAKNRMSHMAHHDFLTDLPNRMLLHERLSQSMAVAQRHGKRVALLFLDLDRFKTINDSLGHAVGDNLLQQVAERLRSSIRATDTVSRQGGDEFVVLISEIDDEQAVSIFADKICKSITDPYLIAEHEVYIGVTIGISLFPDDGEDAETLIRNADVAMYDAKNGGRGRYHFFKKEMNYRVIERQRIEGDLQRALKNDEFELYYQAQVDLHTSDIIGVEALIRWHHPSRGLLDPVAFLSIAEECGAIVPIGRWVLQQACLQLKSWLDIGRNFQSISVNISAMELEKEDFFTYASQVLTSVGLAPHYLELELTETVLMKNTEATMAMLEQLKALGVRVAIDDFGTGYSSLSYLKQFPVDTLKIDQSFVAGIKPDADNNIIVDAVIGLGKNLKHTVVAEGVETRAQLDFLIAHHCAVAQGYFINKPMHAANFDSFFENRA
ncbi:MAG: EAL domain-containing protein [Methylotenera sp.]|nr:EAL domain-containing protein [Methylotenera sp.]